MLRISAKVDYAVRALAELARNDGGSLKGQEIARRQSIPARFLGVTLGELRRHGLVESRRGGEGGYWLALPADQITVAQVFEAIDGEIVDVRAVPDAIPTSTQWVWSLTEQNLRTLLTSVTIADVARQSSIALEDLVLKDPA